MPGISTWLHIGDAVAIIGFALLLRYFCAKPRPWTKEETLLVLFCAGGLVADTVFTAHWLWAR